jgi:hypothetical protein
MNRSPSTHPRLGALPAHPARRRILRSVGAGALAALLVWALIKGAHPAMFEGREDRVLEQCLKTGLAVFAFTLLYALARDQKSTK